LVDKYNDDQDCALSLLYRYLDGSIIKKLGTLKSAREAFMALDNIYLKRGGVEIVLLMHRLVNLKMKGTDVEGYLTEFEGVLSDLEKRGHNMVEVERAMFMLCGIVEEWNTLRSQVFLQYGYDKLTTDVVKAALREQGAAVSFGKLKVKRERRGDEDGDLEKALLAKVVICESCGRRGHTKDKCNTRCYECGKFGHVAAKCPTKEEIPPSYTANKGKKREKELSL
jgi:hypothetical protein